MFCQERPHHKGGTYYVDFYQNTFCVRASGATVIHKVQVTEDPERDRTNKEGYWGWWDLDGKEDRFMFVYAHQTLLNMCFPYGPEAEEQRGKGLRLPVKIEILEANIPLDANLKA
jgi:hypothetical protein